MIHARLEGVARTLLMSLRARADEHSRKDRLFEDQWSHEWYQWMPTYPDLDEWYLPSFQLASAIRTVIIDGITNEFIENHSSPVIVEIGGGLSSRPYRLGLQRAQWVILDLPAAIQVRRKVDQPNPNLLFLSHSVTSDDWVKRLPETDNKSYLFIAEGMLMFLEKQEVMDLIDRLRENFAGSTFLFDALRESYRDREQENFEKLDAEIKFHMDEMDFKGFGLKEQSIDYLLTAVPERWEEIGIDKQQLTKENSGFVVSSLLK